MNERQVPYKIDSNEATRTIPDYHSPILLPSHSDLVPNIQEKCPQTPCPPSVLELTHASVQIADLQKGSQYSGLVTTNEITSTIQSNTFLDNIPAQIASAI